MKTIITGAKGFVGSRLHKRLPDAVGLDRNDGNIISAPLPDADVVYHLAAHAHVPSSWQRPVDYMENLLSVVRLVRDYPNAKIIFASTCATADPSGSPYGFSKWAAEEYLKRFHKNWVVCVFPNIFGNSDRSVVDIFKRSKELKINGDGTNTRDYVHVDNIVEGLLKAQNWPVGRYEMGSGVPVNTLELAQATGKDIHHVPAVPEQKDGVIANTTPDWKPTIDVLEYVKN